MQAEPVLPSWFSAFKAVECPVGIPQHVVCWAAGDAHGAAAVNQKQSITPYNHAIQDPGSRQLHLLQSKSLLHGAVHVICMKCQAWPEGSAGCGHYDLAYTPHVALCCLCCFYTGIGRPTGELPVASYVLQEFRSSEMEAINKAIEESLAIVETCLAMGLDKALSGSRL